jgi:hypothetical protein
VKLVDNGSVTVLYTRPEPTLSALRAARRLTWEDGRPIRVMAIVPVPYTLPLSSPAVPTSFTEQQCRGVVSQSAIAARIDVYLCRDQLDVLRDYLDPGSVVVVGTGRRRWWGMPEKRLVRWLQQHGHSVVLAAPEEEARQRARYRRIVQIRMPNSSH